MPLSSLLPHFQHCQDDAFFGGAVGWDEEIGNRDTEGVGNGVEVVEGDACGVVGV